MSQLSVNEHHGQLRGMPAAVCETGKQVIRRQLACAQLYYKMCCKDRTQDLDVLH